MRRVVAVFEATFKDWIRSRSGLFFSFLFPVMLFIIFGFVFGGGETTRYTLYIQNLDVDDAGEPTELSSIFIDVLNMTGLLSLREVPSDVDGMAYVREMTRGLGERFRLLIIHEGFDEDVRNSSLRSRIMVIYSTLEMFIELAGPKLTSETRGEIELGKKRLLEFNQSISASPAVITLITDPSDRGGEAVKGIIQSVVARFNQRAVGVVDVINVREEEVVIRRLKAVEYYLPGIIGAFIMTNGIIGVTSTVSEFRRRGLVRRLAVTPLTKVEWILGNIITQTLLGLMLTAVMLTVAYIVFDLRALPDLHGVALIFAGAVMFSGIGMLLAGFVKDVEAATALGNAVAFPMMFLSGTFWPLENMPEFMRNIAEYLPLTHLSEGLRSSIILQDAAAALMELALIATMATVFILAGSFFTRWRES